MIFTDMTRRLDEGTAKEIQDVLEERFGEPITDVRPVIAENLTCEGCGCMKQLEEEETCDECGSMPTNIDENMFQPPWGKPPADPGKTWVDSKTRERFVIKR